MLGPFFVVNRLTTWVYWARTDLLKDDLGGRWEAGGNQTKCTRLMTPWIRIRDFYIHTIHCIIIMYARELYVCMWKISFEHSLGRSFDSIFLKPDGMVGFMKNWTCSFWTESVVRWDGSKELRRFQNFRKMKYELPILLKLNKLMRERCFLNFCANQCLRRGTGC